ncbi:MAG: MFS transporter [Terrimicrobiaceae bacterium]|nr:MFS transporter [Terrimicrobiaceae bacterium]
MSLSNPPSPATPEGGKIFTIGTLSYTKGGLLLLFSWLMWNDLCLMLMENVAPTLFPLLLKDHHATNSQIAFFFSTLPGAFTIWINPVVSTWSDRFRSPAGRRRPFLLFATPFCAISLAAIPFMPDLFAYLNRIPAFVHFIGDHSAFVLVLFLGLCFLAYQVFNSVILAIFTYYFWDVVPQEVLGRFSALTKVVSTIAVFIWNYFLLGLADHHMKEVFVGVAVFFLVAYLVSLWNVKEGEYPPTQKGERTGFFGVIGSYFTDCFKPYYVWFIAANAIFQIGNMSNTFQIFIFRDQLHLDLDTIGKMKAIPTLLVVLVGYPMGALVDRLKPGRVMIASLALYGLANIGAFFFLNGKWSLCFFMGLIAIIVCAFGISQGVFIVEFFPREKLGQFCSANALTYNMTSLLAATFVGVFFDWIQNYRYAFLWSTAFYFLSLPLYVKCYLNWLRRQKLLASDSDGLLATAGENPA